MSSFVISCGGTGGHLTPGIALAEELMERGHHCWLIISKKEVDSRLVKNYPKIKFVRVSGVAFSFRPWRLLNFFFQQGQLLVFSLSFLHRIKPHAVIAFGGFIAVGTSLPGLILHCPVILHEANRKPGKAIRLLRGLADRIYLPHGVLLSRVPSRRVKYLGYPVRKQICRLPKEVARRKLGLDTTGKHLVIIGGSQGAEVFNTWVVKHFKALAAEGINVYCLTGIGKERESLQEYRQPNREVIQAHFMPFTDDMGTLLSSADLVISRAGAGAIAELIHCEAPSILIPYPYAADDHQLANARFLEQQGGCVVLEQAHEEHLYDEVLDLIFNDWLLRKLNRNLQRLEQRSSALRIAEDLEKIVTTRREKKKSRGAKVEMPA